jgi:hypothetical protein
MIVHSANNLKRKEKKKKEKKIKIKINKIKEGIKEIQ